MRKPLNIRIYLGDRVYIHKRNVYDFLEFLGDSGGMYESMMIFGTAVHLLISAN